MFRSVGGFLIVAVGFCAGGASPAQAQQISPQNPFRSYNLSGVNYASQQWERDRARSQGTNVTTQPAMRSGTKLFPHRQRIRRR